MDTSFGSGRCGRFPLLLSIALMVVTTPAAGLAQTVPTVAGPEIQTVVTARQTLDQFFGLQIE